ncbi:MAG TPA: hypothetical protein PKH77_11210, partial [Anaerolineae bacterium]|nr:hypothetical protein [Anaerolineae bacterium]
MKNVRLSNAFTWLFIVLCLLILALAVAPIVSTSAQSGDAVAAVTAAWERARAAGAYRYTADLVQTTIPKPLVANIGQTSRQNRVHLEGESNLPEGALSMRLWANGGNVSDAATGAELRVEGDRAYARQGSGEWQEVDNFASLFAPQGDFMAFLAAAQDITDRGAETRQIPTLASSPTAVSFTRYTFRIDGLSYARYLRDQLQQRMAESGELPLGMTLDTPRE